MIKNNFKIKNNKNHSGYTLLFAIILSSILLSVGVFIANITTKEVILSGVVKESAVSYAAAQSGMECALYYHYRGGGVFDRKSDESIPKCSNTSTKFIVDSSNNPTFFTHSFDIKFYQGVERTDSNLTNMCAKVIVRKYFEDAAAYSAGAQPTRTLIESKGYNVDCTRANENNVLKLERAIYFEDNIE